MIITYVLSVVVLLGLCVFVHELGHLLGGKLVGIKARVFSIGFGRGLIKKEWGGTVYQIAPIPLGGYCMFYGDNPSEPLEGKSYEFLTAAPWRRIITVIMGPLFNLIFGILLFFAMNLFGYTSETNKIMIPTDYMESETASVAFNAGMRDGDIITGINGEKVLCFEDIMNSVVFSSGKNLLVEVEREGAKKTFNIKPELASSGYYQIGVFPYQERVLVVKVGEGGAAASAGILERDEIAAVDGVKIASQKDFIAYIKSHPQTEMKLTVFRRGTEMIIPVTPRAREFFTLKPETGRMSEEGYSIDNNDLLKNSIQNGTVSLNGVKVKSIDEMIRIAKISGDKIITLDNAGGSYTGKFSYQRIGFIDTSTFMSPEYVTLKFGLVRAFKKAMVDPFKFIVLNVKGLGMLISGKLNVRDNVSGPVRIAVVAGETVYYRGVSEFIVLMAKISIVLMIMNLLPIPAVDGSHILVYLIEIIRRKPLERVILERIQIIGFIFLLTLGVFVIFNDLSSFSIFQKIGDWFR